MESLKQKTKLVVNENETLFDHLKTKAVTEVLASENQPELEVMIQSFSAEKVTLRALKNQSFYYALFFNLTMLFCTCVG